MNHALRRLASISAIAVLAMAARPVIGAPPSAMGRKPPFKIVCTVGMVADIVRNVAGNRATVENIIGEGVDPHLYQATRGDIGKLLEADVVFYNGLLLEGKMADALVRVGRTRPVHAVTEFLDEGKLLAPPEFAGHHDPHVWMDVSLWKQCADKVAGTMGAFDPDGESTYRANCEKYAAALDRLDAYARRVLESVPTQRRVLVTAHDAFNYLGRAYQVEVRGIQGISTESEAGVDDINKLVDLLVERRIGAVFVESSVSRKNIQSLIEGAAARGHQVTIGGQLFSDAMGKPGTYEGTYIGMIDHNVTTIARALGGEAPAGGFDSKLRGEP